MKKKLLFITLAVLVVGGVASAVMYYRTYYWGKSTLPAQYYASTPGTSQNHKESMFDHVVIIMEENKPADHIIGNAEAPYINKLATTYAQAKNYYAVTHPSLPNYIALTSGTIAGITNDCSPPRSSCQADVTNIADRLEKAGRSWKEYAESMPSPCYASNSGDYAVRHNPFLYYPNIRNDKDRCNAHDVPINQLHSDLSADKLPDYAFVTPNLCNDMHNCSIQTGDNWLAQQVPQILSSPGFTKHHSLLVITWDEGNRSSNNVPIIFAGPAAKQGFTSSTYYSHYSLLHTIENNWQLKPLTSNDKSAPLMTDMLQSSP